MISRPPFTSEEADLFRADINSVRAGGAYVPGRWSVSPLNRDRAVTGAMPGQIRLRDTTARSIDSMPGVVVTTQARAAFLRLLAEAGVSEIVTGGLGRRDLSEVRDDLAMIRAHNPGARLVCPFVSGNEAADQARECGYDAVQVSVPGFGPASLIYEGAIYRIAGQGRDWRQEVTARGRADFVARATAIIAHARGLGLRVIAPLMMVSYLTTEVLGETAGALIAAGAAEITLFDGPGSVGPEAFAHLVRETASVAAPGVDVGLHPHNTFGLAVACAVAAARAGADVIDSSVNGYCGGTGNAELAATAVAFEALYGVRTGIRLDRLTGLARAAEELTGYRMARSQPVTGHDAFCWGGADWVAGEEAIDPLLHNCVEPAIVGNQRYVPLTPDSGTYVMSATLRRIGVEVGPAAVSAILRECHAEIATRGRLLDDEEIHAIAETVLRDQPGGGRTAS